MCAVDPRRPAPWRPPRAPPPRSPGPRGSTATSPRRCCGRAGSSTSARCPTTCAPCTRPAAARPTPSIATAGATTRSCGPRTASTAPARARRRSTSRTGSSPGRRSRPTTPQWAPTARSTSRAAAPGAPRSPGTRTRRPASATPTSGGRCSRCTARPRTASATRCSRGPTSSGTRSGRAYKATRGKGGFVRATWDEALEMVAAAHVHTIKAWGPDRVAGFSPIPAMSMVSHAIGARFVSLVGGVMLSFYDWYADLPVASPQVFGDQTDVPESADWWDAAYLVMWGSNVPVTRTPDAHYMAEARYRGQKVVVVSPDYADNVKFADQWLHPHPGTDAALATAMTHVVLQEFFVDRQVPYFFDYVTRYSDLPFLVTLREHGDAFVPDKFLTAADLGDTGEGARFKTVLYDDATGEPV